MTAVTVSGVTAGYGRTPVLDSLDLEIPAGAITAILGESGSGKTTLLRILAGFLKPRCGTVRFGERLVAGPGDGGRDIFLPPEKRRVGIVPQEGALFPHLSVAANVGFGLPHRSRDRVGEVLRLVGMADRADARPHELSGGQQQRVALARALAPQPDVLLLDEPFSSLDAALRVRLRTEVRELLRSVGSTAVLVTHDQEEALSTADNLAVMRGGRIVQTGTPIAVYDAPADIATARFVGDAVELPATAAAVDARVRCALGEVPVSGDGVRGLNGTSVVVFRPEQLVLSPSDGPGTAPGSGIVRERTYHGHDSLLWVELVGGPRIPVRVPGGAPVPGAGEAVMIRVIGAGRLYPV